MLRWLSVSAGEFSLQGRGATLFAALIVVASLAFAFEAGRVALASMLGGTVSIRDLRRAVALDAANPALQDALGRGCLQAPDACPSAAALHHLRRAVDLNPRKSIYWSDLAAACEAASDDSCAEEGFARAVALSPMTPRYRWLEANYELRRGQSQEALGGLRRLLELDPAYAPAAFDAGLRLLADPRLIFSQMVPPGSPALRLACVNFLSARGQADAARAAWAETIATSRDIQFDGVRPYLERLISTDQYDAAASVWNDLERAGVVAAPEAGNLVFNGGFEHAPLNAGFDWRHASAQPYVAVAFADPAARDGARALRLDFTAPSNNAFEPVWQLISVHPNQAYVLSAQVRSEEITSDSGPRLRVLDPLCVACLDASTESVTGTTPWHEVRLGFSTGGSTRVIQLSLWRPRSRSFPPEITGRFWICSVGLVPSD